MAGLASRTLTPIRPNAGLTRAYQKQLENLIEEMHRSVIYWVRAAFRRRPSEAHRLNRRVAHDESPASELDSYLRQLETRWQRRFNLLAPRIAGNIITKIAGSSDAQLLRTLRAFGFAKRFRATRPWNDVVRAAISENVELIKSIPERYLSDVKVSVMRAMQRGVDVDGLTAEIENKFHVTYRRAAMIARDQTNKTTAMSARTRLLEVGVREAIWVHNGAVKHPRHSHLKAGKDQVRFRLDQGWYDPEVTRYIMPGELINCKCVARPVLPDLMVPHADIEELAA